MKSNMKHLGVAFMMATAVGASAETVVTWSTLGNSVTADGKPVYTQRFTINSDKNFARLAFNQFETDKQPVDASDSIIEIVPSYYAIKSPKFADAKGKTVVVDIVTAGTFSNICFAPDGVHLVNNDGTTSPVEMKWDNIIESPEMYSNGNFNRMPYGDALFLLNEQRNRGEQLGAYDIIPSFKEVSLTDGAPTDASACEVTIVETENPQPDWMQITVDGGRITAKTNNKALARTRINNLLSRGGMLPAAVITDYPDFGYRGLMIDIARNYQSPEEMERILQLMSRYGFNVLHFHIADDEAWRLEIPGLPELTDVGGRRGYTLDGKDFLPQIYSGDGNPATTGNSSNGYFTRTDFINLLKKADELGIRVIPEIESPGHARAAIVAMENRLRNTGDDTYRLMDPDDKSVYSSAQDYHDNVMNLAMPGPMLFMTKVGEEIKRMYSDAGVELPAIHIGGDEVAMGAWKGSPIAQAYMADHGITNERDLHLIYVRDIVKAYDKLGIPVSGWQEIAVGHDEEFNNEVRPYIYSVNCWSTLGGESSVPAQSATAGYPTVLSNVDRFYMDLVYNFHPQERGLTWGGAVDEFKSLGGYPKELCQVDENSFKNVIGLSGQLFSETVRSPQMLESYLLPKMLGLAERAWNMDTTYTEPRFNAAVNREMPVWNREGYNFHVGLPGITVRDGYIIMNAPYPDVEIRYTLDGSEPTAESPLYTDPIRYSGQDVRARAFLPQYGKHSLTTIYLPK